MINHSRNRVLCLIDSLSSGGAQRQMVGLAGLLKMEGYEVKVVTYYDFPFYLPQILESGVDYEYLPCTTGLIDRFFKIGSTIKQFKPGCVISYLDTPNILSCLLHSFHKREWKLIVSERNTTQILSIRERMKFALYRFADYVVPNSYSQAEFIAKYYPNYTNKCHVITNFVETEVFTPIENKKFSRTLRIIGVGRIAEQKNIPMLIEAIKIVHERGYDVHVDWYGSKFETYDICFQLIKQYHLESVFMFHDTSSNIIRKYQESDIIVLPSNYEGFPNVLCEAMSCGLPVIATDVCDNGRIVHNNENGYLILSGDTMNLAQKLIQFMELPIEKRRAMGEKSRKLSVTLFSKVSFVEKYVKLIESQS